MMNDFANLDLTKYDRIFAIGCSFTCYRWPTWADVLVRGNGLDDKFINLGRAGAGNQFISYTISLANLKYKFTERDLVMVMFTGYTREDRYVKDRWQTPGNIYTQPYYPPDFVEKYCDLKGYFIRDGAIIDMAVNYLKNLPCDTIAVPAVPFSFMGPVPPEVKTLVGGVIDQLPKSFYNSVILTDVARPGFWQHGASYYDAAHTTEKYNDYHSTPLTYYKYLKNLGIPMEERVYQYAETSTEQLRNCETHMEIEKVFPNCREVLHTII